VKENVDVIDLEFSEFLKIIRNGDTVEVYTDGSCIGNPGPGGWGSIFVLRDNRTNLSGFEKHTTNNRMELKAAIEAIKAVPPTVQLIIYTDSTYVKNGITIWIQSWRKNNWKSSSGKSVKNQDLWLELSLVINGRNIEWVWVKGHAECMNNNNADFIARSAIITSYMKEDD
jgi:ribonuclease HI